MAELPDGVVTFLFTDVEGSTGLWEEATDSMMAALVQHDGAIDEAVSAHNGISVKPRGEGDSRFVVFGSAVDALIASAEMQRRLAAVDWATPRPLRVRASLHTGTADLQLGDYYGSAVNRAARLRAIAHGGQTVMSGSTWELVQDQLPDAVTITDMGLHRLKDLTRPEHVYQVNVAGLENTFPPLASLDAVPNNLPLQLTEFVGREVELKDAKSIISETRLLTILAPGGAGKTRLAIQAAADVAADYPDGAFFVDLAPVGSADEMAQTAAESIGVSLATDQDLQTQLVAHLGNKRLLLIFDNFEHVAHGVTIVSEILRAAPDVKVIATSRVKLNVTGETVLKLSGLDVTWDTPKEADRTSGVRLFVDAGTRADASFSLESDDLDPLARILQLVEGMPLAILLSAAWVDTLSIDEIAHEIARSMDFLETDVRDGPDRHRSMRAVFDYTWELLPEDERRVFAALSVFRGGFSREAAKNVTDASLRDLANLVNKSLVVSDRDSARYYVHELLRQYAEEQLQQDRAHVEAVRAAHTSYFADRIGQVEELISADQVQALDMVEDDLDNVRWAWRQSVETKNARAARQLIVGLWLVHEVRGWTKIGAELFAETRESFAIQPGDEATMIVHAAAAAIEAKFLVNLGHADWAAGLAAEAVDTLRPLSDPVALLMALEAHSEVLGYASGWHAVLDLSTEAIRVAEEAGYELWSAGMRNYQAGVYLQLGDIDTAMRLLDEGDQVLSQIGDRFMRTWNLEMQAMIAMMQDRVGDAIELHGRAAELAEEVGYVRGVALTLQGLGQAYTAKGDFSGADDALLESLARYEQMGLAADMAGVLVMVARIRTETGHKEEAVEILASVLADPASDQQLIIEMVSIDEAATAALGRLEEELDPKVYAGGHARGAAKTLDVIVKELLAVPR